MFNLKEFLRNNPNRPELGDPEDMSDCYELVEDVIYPDIEQIQSMVYVRVVGCDQQTLLKRKICGIYEYCYMFRVSQNDEDGDDAYYQWYTLEWCDTKENNSGVIDRPNEVVFTITKKEFKDEYCEFCSNDGVNWFCTFIQSFLPNGYELRSHEVCEQFVKAAPHCFGESVFGNDKYPYMFITSGLTWDFGLADNRRMALLDQIPDDYVFNFIGHIVE